MKDSIEIYTMIRRWEDIRSRLIANVRLKQTSYGENSTLTFESEQKLREELNQITSSFMEDSTDVEYIVTHTFPHLKKGAWIENIYIEENKIDFEGYEYYLYKNTPDKDNLESKYNSLEEAVEEALRLTGTNLEVSDAINKLYF